MTIKLWSGPVEYPAQEEWQRVIVGRFRENGMEEETLGPPAPA